MTDCCIHTFHTSSREMLAIDRSIIACSRRHAAAPSPSLSLLASACVDDAEADDSDDDDENDDVGGDVTVAFAWSAAAAVHHIFSNTRTAANQSGP